MDWSVIYYIIGLIITWLIINYVGGKIIAELKEALEASVLVAQESADMMVAVAKALEDGQIDEVEIAAIVKEYKEMVAAGALAGKEWKDVLDAILEKVRN